MKGDAERKRYAEKFSLIGDFASHASHSRCLAVLPGDPDDYDSLVSGSVSTIVEYSTNHHCYKLPNMATDLGVANFCSAFCKGFLLTWATGTCRI